MVENNKTCIVCGKTYTYCPNCSSYSKYPLWYDLFDGENCYEIYDACASYRDKIITKENAKKKLDKCNINNITSTKLKSLVNEIVSVDKAVNVENNVDIKKDIKTNFVKKQK